MTAPCEYTKTINCTDKNKEKPGKNGKFHDTELNFNILKNWKKQSYGISPRAGEIVNKIEPGTEYLSSDLKC